LIRNQHKIIHKLNKQEGIMEKLKKIASVVLLATAIATTAIATLQSHTFAETLIEEGGSGGGGGGGGTCYTSTNVCYTVTVRGCDGLNLFGWCVWGYWETTTTYYGNPQP
jgi:hypothetical protein